MRLRSFIRVASAALALAASTLAAPAADTPDPVTDAKAFRSYFVTKFPKAMFPVTPVMAADCPSQLGHMKVLPTKRS